MGKILIIKGANFSTNAVAHVEIGTSITVVASPSAGGVVTGSGNYAEGDQVTLTASPNSGFLFDGWSDGVTTPSRTITVGSQAQTYTALFSAKPEKPSTDENVDAAVAYSDYIFDASPSLQTGINISAAILNSRYTTNFQIYKCSIEYTRAVYEVTMQDNLNDDNASYIYRYGAICNSSDEVIGYILKHDIAPSGGKGQRVFNIDMSNYANAEYLYIATYNNVISVIAKAE